MTGKSMFKTGLLQSQGAQYSRQERLWVVLLSATALPTLENRLAHLSLEGT